jgi:hypothetical protein
MGFEQWSTFSTSPHGPKHTLAAYEVAGLVNVHVIFIEVPLRTCSNTDQCMAVSISYQNCYLKGAVSQCGYSPIAVGMWNRSNLIFIND